MTSKSKTVKFTSQIFTSKIFLFFVLVFSGLLLVENYIWHAFYYGSIKSLINTLVLFGINTIILFPLLLIIDLLIKDKNILSLLFKKGIYSAGIISIFFIFNYFFIIKTFFPLPPVMLYTEIKDIFILFFITGIFLPANLIFSGYLQYLYQHNMAEGYKVITVLAFFFLVINAVFITSFLGDLLHLFFAPGVFKHLEGLHTYLKNILSGIYIYIIFFKTVFVAADH